MKKLPHIFPSDLDSLKNEFLTMETLSPNDRKFWFDLLPQNFDDVINPENTEAIMIIRNDLNPMEKLELAILRKYNWKFMSNNRYH